MGDVIKAIGAVYNGYRFRSRLEARWAMFFDFLGIPYVYEPEGLKIGGICYLPDFYLPDCKQFFEVKGVMDSDSEEKINALIKAGYSVTVGYDDGRFQACDNWSYPEESPTFELSNDSGLFKCATCGKYWFMGNYGIWTCQCCGTHEGDHHLIPIMYCYRDKTGTWHDPDRKEWDVARQARFEHGETPVIRPQSEDSFDDLLEDPFGDI